ncbi:MAG: penicillin-binding protein 1C [Nonlabens sp.]
MIAQAALKQAKNHKIKLMVVGALLIAYVFCLPRQLFDKPTSTVVFSRESKLLGAKIATDGQWRFPPGDSIPEKFKACVLQFEDRYFESHPGFNPVSLFNALRENWQAGMVKRGGSTITQQVVRMARGNPRRSYLEKAYELILATRMELRYSKDEIFSFWANNAPFGGNVVGLEAASWRYYNRNSDQLSWAETATLAVLPNAPSLIFPGKNRELLRKKRNRLLNQLYRNGDIDSLDLSLSMQEPLPGKPYDLPKHSMHLVERMDQQQRGENVISSLDFYLQQDVNDIVAQHQRSLSQNKIHNMAVLVMEVSSRKVRAYVGNSSKTITHDKHVDVIQRARSTGSILKPFLYAAMLTHGEILPETVITDVPTQIGTYRPENFDKTFTGIVPASLALSRSLNVPAVRMLRNHGVDRFHRLLTDLDFSSINRPADHYGLSLILGGAEVSLWELCKNYAFMASTVNHYNRHQQYYTQENASPILLASKRVDFGTLSRKRNYLTAASLYHTLESLKDVNRPSTDQNWRYYASSQEIAWKTGTSFGFRDAWAVGTTSDYVVGVWVGNTTGEGRPGLVGVETAAPIMFEVFDKLPDGKWFDPPLDEMESIITCTQSGMRALPICETKESRLVPIAGLKSAPCKYHQSLQLDKTLSYQVDASCRDIDDIASRSWFVLPPIISHYYKKGNPMYQITPPYHPDCSSQAGKPLELIYPNDQSEIYLPRLFDEEKGTIVFKAVHTNPQEVLYWHLNDEYIGATQDFHEINVRPRPGLHQLTVVDQSGFEISKPIEILASN